MREILFRGKSIETGKWIEHLEEQEGEDEDLICVNKDCVYQDDDSTYRCGAEHKDGEPFFPTCQTRIIGNELTKKQIQILTHSLGWDKLRWYDIKKIEETPYRNYFFTSPSTSDYAVIKSLIAMNLMKASGCVYSESSGSYFSVTEKGLCFAYCYVKNQLKSEKPTRSKRRYECYLHCESDETFIEWLKNSYWDDCRKRYNC